jgi:cell division septum initiation protein DivIVA
LEKRIKELEKQLEHAQMKNVALNTMIDIAEQEYKLEVRKKSGPKQ